MGQEVSLAQTLLRGKVKTESWDSVISSWQIEIWFYTVGKPEGINWRRAGSESRSHILGLPQRPTSPTEVKLTSERDPGNTAKEGRQGQQQHGYPKTNFGGTVIFLTDLPGP